MVAEILGCPIYMVDKQPIRLKMEALAYSKVMEKAKPGLEIIAEQRAEQKAHQKRLMESAKRRRGR